MRFQTKSHVGSGKWHEYILGIVALSIPFSSLVDLVSPVRGLVAEEVMYNGR